MVRAERRALRLRWAPSNLHGAADIHYAPGGGALAVGGGHGPPGHPVRTPMVTGGLVAARSLAAGRGLLAAHGWVGGPRGWLYQLFTHCFFF